jgi:hypothetical protein
MKRIANIMILIIFLPTWLNGQIGSFDSNQEKGCVIYPNQLDSVYAFTWNKDSGEWDFNTIWQYQNSNGRHDRLLFINALNRTPKQSWDYYYDGNGNRFLDISKVWWGDKWNLYFQRESEFNDLRQKSKQVTSFWRNEEWQLSYSHLYEYSDVKLSRIVYQKPDADGYLYDVSYTDYLYDNELLQYTREFNSSDKSLIRVSQYSYNINGSLREVIIKVPDHFSGEQVSFNAFKRQVYSYDEFGLLRELVLQDWNGANWEFENRYMYFYSLDKAKKVFICHNGKTICVSVNALKAHLANGGKLGQCTDDNNAKEKNRNYDNNFVNAIPFKIYPNPAVEKIYIKYIGNGDHGVKRVELIDSYGTVVKIVNVKGEKEILVSRGNLKSGHYYIRMSGALNYNSSIVFN